jgi:serine/threonine-protein kinase HipA
LTRQSDPVLVGELKLVRTTQGVSLEYAPDWLKRGFPLSEDLPLASGRCRWV